MDWTTIFGGKSPQRGNKDLGSLFAAIEKMLDGRPVDEVKRITGWAGLLGRVAYADLELAPEELAGIGEVLEQVHGLGPESARRVVGLIETERVQLLSIEDHFYARMINEVATPDEKRELLRALFRVAAADGIVAEREEAAIRVVSKALLLGHDDFIAARLLVRDSVPVLRRDP
ncbi:MAG: TerB family tellurite resistance protein [Deltaproteobacteria bacterium]|nr:TerB family tellurite resistance protein [Deltaproteobacteria bacterium]